MSAILGLIDALPIDLVSSDLGMTKDLIYAAVDDLVGWGLRSIYFNYLVGESSRPQTRSLQEYYRSRWSSIHKKASPKGPVLENAAGSIHSHRSAQILSVLYGLVCVYSYGSADPKKTPPRNSMLALHHAYRDLVKKCGGVPSFKLQVLCAAINDVHVSTRALALGLPTVELLRPAVCSDVQCSKKHPVVLHQQGHDYMTKCPFCLSHVKPVF